MKKKILIMLAVMVAMLSLTVATANAETVKESATENSESYTISSSGKISVGDLGFDTTTGTIRSCNKNAWGFLEIPNEINGATVTTISSSAFNDCTDISGILIPASVTQIEPFAFRGCHSLSIMVDSDNPYFCDIHEVLYSKDQTQLCAYTLDNLRSEFIIPQSVEIIYDGAFADCQALTNITLPARLSTIGSRAFANCTSLSSLVIPHGVQHIGDDAFTGCTSLTDIYYVGTLEEWENISEGTGADTVTVHCSDRSTDGTENPLLSSITFNSETGEIVGFDKKAEGVLIIPSEIDGVPVKKIGEEAFYGCSGITSVFVPDGVTSIGKLAFSQCKNLTRVILPDSVTDIEQNTFKNCSKLKSANIPRGIMEVPDRMFEQCTSLVDVYIPNSVDRIGKESFYFCTNLADIVIPSSVTLIDDNAFAVCNASNLKIYGGTTLGYRAFEGCRMSSVTIPKSVTTIGGEAFWNCRNLSKINILGDNVEIGVAFTDTPFYDDENNWDNDMLYISNHLIKARDTITSADIRQGTKSIAAGAFSKCINITNIEFPDSVVHIGSSAFYGCTGLTNVYIPEHIVYLGGGAFGNCRNIENINIPDNIEHIEDGLLLGCSSLTDIKIPDGVTSIGNSAFSNCSALTSIKIPDGVTSIGMSAFSNCTSLTNIEIPDGVTTIMSGLFNGCTQLSDIVLPDGITKIYPGAFTNTGYYNGAWGGDVLYISNYLIKAKQGTQFISIRPGTKVIADEAFYECRKLVSASFPDSVIGIGDKAFLYCESMTSAKLNEGLKDIGYRAFWYCTSLNEMVIPNSVERIGEDAFEFCKKINNLELPANITNINNSAFYACDGITIVSIPDNVQSIGERAFEGCSELIDINFTNITNIDRRAFASCEKLECIEIPLSVTDIGEEAFKDCIALTDIYYPGSESQWFKIVGNSNIPEEATIHYNTPKPFRALVSGYIKNDNYEKIPWTLYSDGNLVFSSNTASSAVSTPSLGQYTHAAVSAEFEEGIKSIELSMLPKCVHLKKVIIPSSVKSITNESFYSTKELRDVFYRGSETQWSKISIGYYNDILKNVAVHYYYLGDVPLQAEPTIDKSSSYSRWNLEINIEKPYDNCEIYVAVYNNEGKCIRIVSTPLKLEGATSIQFPKSYRDNTAKVFIWTKGLQPISAVAEVSLAE